MLAFRHRLLTALSIGWLSLAAGTAPVLACADDEETGSDPAGPFATTIVLSELLPAPSAAGGEEEFIELQNTGSVAVDLAGWMLADASGRKYTISTDDFVSTSVKAGGYFVVPLSVSKIYLNNDTDRVSLLQPDGTELDSTEYEGADYDHSWSLIGGNWQWSLRATSGAKNVAASPETVVPAEEPAAANADASDESNAAAAPFERSAAVALNELFPNPSGSESTEEWIEIMNTGASPVYLGGWQLTDQSRYFEIGEVTIAAGEYLVFDIAETGINLNNTGDTVYLVNPFDEIVSGTEYGTAAEDETWARQGDGSWAWSAERTPAAENSIVTAARDGEAAADADTTAAFNDAAGDAAADLLTIAELRALEPGSTGQIEGVVTVLPGVFGSQYFYIQDETAGIQVYSYRKDFPGLAVGDRVQVTGETSEARGELRLKTASSSNVVVLGAAELPVALGVTELEEAVEGMVVAVSGIVTQSSSTSATLNGTIELALKDGAGIDRTNLTEGSQVTVVGIVSQSDATYRLLPRSNDDIDALESDGLELVPAAQAAGLNSDGAALSAQSEYDQSQNLTIAILVIVGLVVILLTAFARQKWLSWLGRLAKVTGTQPAALPAAAPPKSMETIFSSAAAAAGEKKKG
jgi:DNA/RNA endonuclease YhcR with UshA esterase domain